MAWFLHIVEQDDGTWACRHGLIEVDRHEKRSSAIAHQTVLAQEHAPAELIVHRADGTVEHLGII